MDNQKHIATTEQYQDRIKELFKEFATEELYDAWVDAFEVDSVNEKQVIIAYHGTEPLKTFKQDCEKILISCIDSVLGEGKKVKILKKLYCNRLSPKTIKNMKALKFFAIGMLFVCIATAIILVMCNYIGNRNFRETFYNVSSIKVDSPVRVIQLSDMHGTSYGKQNKKLLERVKALNPDIIICTGDMVDSAEKDADYAVSLAQELTKIAPAYYVYGNNEVESVYDFPIDHEKDLDQKFGFHDGNRDETALLKIKDSFEEKLEKTGIKVLKNEKDTIKVKTMMVDVYGVLNSNPSTFWSYSGKSFENYIYENTDHLKITAIHEPILFEEFQPDFWGDLMVCGHTHGGVVRVPFLGPLFTLEGGLFPERGGGFVYGRYDVAGKPLVVSGGLENSNIFRVNNQPELVIIDINKF